MRHGDARNQCIQGADLFSTRLQIGSDRGSLERRGTIKWPQLDNRNESSQLATAVSPAGTIYVNRFRVQKG